MTEARRPSLLFISPHFLFHMAQGGKIRSGNILRALKGGAFEVTLASPRPEGVEAHQAELDSACDHFVSWPEEPAGKFARLASILSPLPIAAASDVSRAGSACVANAIAQKPDVVVVDFPHAGVLTPKQIDAATVLFTHNVEAEIFERHAQRARGLWRWVWNDQSRKMTRFEGDVLRRTDCSIAVSKRDKAALSARYGLANVETIDTGVDLDFFTAAPADAAPDPGADGGTLVFTATMSWPANVDGINFLLDEVWPTLVQARPNIRACIIGQNPPAALVNKVSQRALNVELTGFVDDIRPYVARSNVYVIPLFVGSGTRIKAFEAMAMGRPVVSTALGVEGLDVVDGETFLRADDAEEVSRASLSLLDDGAKRARLASAGRQLVEERFSWATVGAQFQKICLSAMGRYRARHDADRREADRNRP